MKKTIKIYVDYALGGKIGIFSEDLNLRIGFKPKEKVVLVNRR